MDSLLQKAESLFDRGKFQESLHQYQQVLNIYRLQGDRLGESIALTGIVMVQISLRSETQALENLQRAIAIVQSPPQNLSATDKLLYRKAEGETQFNSQRTACTINRSTKVLSADYCR